MNAPFPDNYRNASDAQIWGAEPSRCTADFCLAKPILTALRELSEALQASGNRFQGSATDPMRDALDRLDDRTAEDIARIEVIVSAGL